MCCRLTAADRVAKKEFEEFKELQEFKERSQGTGRQGSVKRALQGNPTNHTTRETLRTRGSGSLRFLLELLLSRFPHLEGRRSQGRSRMPPTAMLLKPDLTHLDRSSRELSPD